MAKREEGQTECDKNIEASIPKSDKNTIKQHSSNENESNIEEDYLLLGSRVKESKRNFYQVGVPPPYHPSPDTVPTSRYYSDVSRQYYQNPDNMISKNQTCKQDRANCVFNSIHKGSKNCCPLRPTRNQQEECQNGSSCVGNSCPLIRNKHVGQNPSNSPHENQFYSTSGQERNTCERIQPNHQPNMKYIENNAYHSNHKPLTSNHSVQRHHHHHNSNRNSNNNHPERVYQDVQNVNPATLHEGRYKFGHSNQNSFPTENIFVKNKAAPNENNAALSYGPPRIYTNEPVNFQSIQYPPKLYNSSPVYMTENPNYVLKQPIQMFMQPNMQPNVQPNVISLAEYQNLTNGNLLNANQQLNPVMYQEVNRTEGYQLNPVQNQMIPNAYQAPVIPIQNVGASNFGNGFEQAQQFYLQGKDGTLYLVNNVPNTPPMMSENNRGAIQYCYDPNYPQYYNPQIRSMYGVDQPTFQQNYSNV